MLEQKLIGVVQPLMSFWLELSLLLGFNKAWAMPRLVSFRITFWWKFLPGLGTYLNYSQEEGFCLLDKGCLADREGVLVKFLFHWAWNLPSFILSPHSATSTLFILAICRMHVKYEPHLVYGLTLHEFSIAQVDRAPTRCLGGHRFESCRGLRFFFVPRSWHTDRFIFTSYLYFGKILKWHHFLCRLWRIPVLHWKFPSLNLCLIEMSQ